MLIYCQRQNRSSSHIIEICKSAEPIKKNCSFLARFQFWKIFTKMCLKHPAINLNGKCKWQPLRKRCLQFNVTREPTLPLAIEGTTHTLPAHVHSLSDNSHSFKLICPKNDTGEVSRVCKISQLYLKSNASICRILTWGPWVWPGSVTNLCVINVYI